MLCMLMIVLLFFARLTLLYEAYPRVLYEAYPLFIMGLTSEFFFLRLTLEFFILMLYALLFKFYNLLFANHSFFKYDKPINIQLSNQLCIIQIPTVTHIQIILINSTPIIHTSLHKHH
jgi:hypothetical protein